MSPALRALVFDVDGTLADTEHFHRTAFNLAFAEAGLDWQWDEALYTQLLQVSGGRERIRHHWERTQAGRFEIDGRALDDIVERVHVAKNAAYEAMVASGRVPLRPGVLALMEQALRDGLPLAIATTTSPVNVAALLRQAIGPQWKLHFPVVCDGATAPRKKPHPQVYLQVLQRLRQPARSCIAFEDSANGLRAATGAGLATVVTPTSFTRGHDFDGALRVLPSLDGVTLEDLRGWQAG
ncbi:HAD-IA family hydrolase [Ramlibacter sp. AN1133]|uniref:HAD-IA family hydrolase n=1 Tax=Ramlibacter sp. AN1133 TaxID=3133429 RepID=UPI0030BA9A2B